MATPEGVSASDRRCDDAGVSGWRRRLRGPTAAVGFAVGLAGGLIGLGGAELRLPYLVGVLLLAPRAAVPVNLAVSLITVLAALPPRLGAIEAAALAPWGAIALMMTAGAVVAAYLGAGWLRRMPSALLARVIGALLVALGIVLLIEAVIPLVPAGLLPADPVVRSVAACGFGLGIGVISSLLGVAGGEVIIPVLVIGFGLPVTLAGTLSLMISLPTIVVGMARHAAARAFADGDVVRLVILPLALGALVGAPIGGMLAAHAPAPLIKALLGALLIWSAWKFFAKRT